MTRRKQYCPKKHDAGTNSDTNEETAPTDDTDVALDYAKNIMSPDQDHQRSGIVSEDDQRSGQVIEDDQRSGTVLEDDQRSGTVIRDDQRSGTVIEDDQQSWIMIENDQGALDLTIRKRRWSEKSDDESTTSSAKISRPGTSFGLDDTSGGVAVPTMVRGTVSMPNAVGGRVSVPDVISSEVPGSSEAIDREPRSTITSSSVQRLSGANGKAPRSTDGIDMVLRSNASRNSAIGSIGPIGDSSTISSIPLQATTSFAPLYAPPIGGIPSFPFPLLSSSGQSCDLSGDSLSKLSSFVHQLGKGGSTGALSLIGGSMPMSTNGREASTNGEGGHSLQEALGAAAGQGLSFQELWLRFVKKEENAELKRLNEAKQIFTCLQCHASFQTMEQLVKHMETTQHYANIPKHYSWSLQYARQRMRQIKMKMKYSDKMMYYCFLCTSPFTEPVHIHFNCVHNMHNPVENMKFVHVISVNGKSTDRAQSASSITPPLLRNGNQSSTDRSNRLSTSPQSADGSSCGSQSASPSPSTKKHVNESMRNIIQQGSTLSQSAIDCRVNTGSYTDNLLLKMEKLVQHAVGEKNGDDDQCEKR